MANLSLPNLTLGIPVWYLTPPAETPPDHPKPYIVVTPVQSVPFAPSTTTEPLAPPQDPPHDATPTGKKRKTREGASKDKATTLDPTPPPPAKPYALCDGIGHPTHTCPELPHIQPMVKVIFLESIVPETPVSSSAAKNPKTLHTNKPYALCGVHGHYSHHFPHLTHYRASLEVIREYEVEQNQSTSPILAQYASGNLEDPPTTIDIPPPNVEMLEFVAPLLYLSSSA